MRSPTTGSPSTATVRPSGRTSAPSTGLPPEVAAGGPNCWLVVGFYDDVAVRTPEGWRLSSVKLTVTHQENEALLAASIAAAKR